MMKNKDNTEQPLVPSGESTKPPKDPQATARIQQALADPKPTSASNKVNWWQPFLFGGIAGSADACLNYPWVSARKMWISNHKINFTRKDLYLGCSQYSIGIIPTTALQYGIFAIFAQLDQEAKHTSTAAFLSGFGSAIFSTASEHLILTQQKSGATTFKAIQSVHQQYGLSRLWTGFIPFGLRDGGYAFGMLRGHELLKHYFFNDDDRYDIVCKIFSGILSAAFTQPFDVIGTQVQCETGKRPRPFLEVAPTIYRTAGLKGFFPGFWLRTGSVTAGILLMSSVNDKLNERFNPK